MATRADSARHNGQATKAAATVRDRFPEYYSPSTEDVARFVTQGVVVPDTNVLLGLYRLATEEREQVLAAFELVQDRLWLPYQVGFEYQRNRMGVIRQQASAYSRLRDLQVGGQPMNSLPPWTRSPFPSRSEKRRVRCCNRCPRRSQPLPTHSSAVSMTSRPTRGHGGNKDSQTTLSEQGSTDSSTAGWASARVTRRGYVESRKGFVECRRCSPGFKDAKKETDEQKTGDYLLWSEMLDRAEATAGDGHPYLFVTDDQKEDWYERSGGQAVGPQPALLREFALEVLTATTRSHWRPSLPSPMSIYERTLSPERLSALRNFLGRRKVQMTGPSSTPSSNATSTLRR
jgi:hypothetical protein